MEFTLRSCHTSRVEFPGSPVFVMKLKVQCNEAETGNSGATQGHASAPVFALIFPW